MGLNYDISTTSSCNRRYKLTALESNVSQKVLENMYEELDKDIRSGMNIISKHEYQHMIQQIANEAAAFVIKTLGPYGTSTLIDDGMSIFPSKDGWHGLKVLHFSDAIYNRIYWMLQRASFNNAHRVGDGTTTAFCTATYFINNLMKYVNNSFEDYTDRQAELLDAVKKAQNIIIDKLEHSEEIRKINRNGDFSDLYKVALVIANGNEEIAKMIQEIYQETNNPDIYFEIGNNTETTYTIDDGYRFDCNPIMLQAFMNEIIQKDEHEIVGFYKETDADVAAFFFDHTVTYREHIQILTALSKCYQGRQIIVFAPHFDDALCGYITSLTRQMKQNGGIPNILLVQIGLANEVQRGIFRELTYITNAQVFDYPKVSGIRLAGIKQATELRGEKWNPETVDDLTKSYMDTPTEEIFKMCCGRLSTFTIGEKYCMINDYERFADIDLLRQEKEKARREYEKLRLKADRQTTELTNEFLGAQMRYIRLTGKIGRISIGGYTDQEKKYLYDVYEDVVFGCKSAYEYGTVRGLNLTTIKTINDAAANLKEDKLVADILELLRDSFLNVSYAALLNKYISEDIYPKIRVRTNVPDDNKLIPMKLEKIIEYALENDMSFDLTTNTLYPIEQQMIIEPVKTDIEIIRSITTILTTVMTCSQMVTMSRNFDKGFTKAIQREQEARIIKEDARYKADGIIESIQYNDVNGCFFDPNVPIKDIRDELIKGIKDPLGEITAYHGCRCEELEDDDDDEDND